MGQVAPSKAPRAPRRAVEGREEPPAARQKRPDRATSEPADLSFPRRRECQDIDTDPRRSSRSFVGSTRGGQTARLWLKRSYRLACRRPPVADNASNMAAWSAGLAPRPTSHQSSHNFYHRISVRQCGPTSCLTALMPARNEDAATTSAHSERWTSDEVRFAAPSMARVRS